MGFQSEKGDLSSCHVLFDSEQTAGNVKIQDLTPNFPKFPQDRRYEDFQSSDRTRTMCHHWSLFESI